MKKTIKHRLPQFALLLFACAALALGWLAYYAYSDLKPAQTPLQFSLTAGSSLKSAAQDRKIASASAEMIGIGKKPSFRRWLAEVQTLQDAGVTQTSRVVSYGRMLVERLAHLPEGPALDEGDDILGIVAFGDFSQQIKRRERSVDFVISRFDAGGLA